MRIYSTERNPFGLQLLVFAKIAKRKAELCKIDHDHTNGDSIASVPLFELENGEKVFSVVSAAKYLFPAADIKRDEWLEWSVSVLAPALAQQINASKHNNDIHPNVCTLLAKIDESLKRSPYLAGNALTPADISVWCLLCAFPNFESNCKGEHTMAWFKKIRDLPEVQEALQEELFRGVNIVVLHKYGGLYRLHANASSSSSSSCNNNSIPVENQQAALETISSEELSRARSCFIPSSKPYPEEPHTILPKSGERNVLITSALPYVNNVPHLGNIIGCVLSADIFARYSRAAGYNTLYICGTDEYGTATENKAIAEKMTPREICDKYFELHNSIYRWFGIGFDYFGRTTAPEQTEIVQDAFKKVEKAGFITTDSVEQLLCPKCDRFLADRFVEGTCPHPGCGYDDARGDQCDKCGKLINAIELISPRCKMCNTKPVRKCSSHLFLDLPKIEPKLRDWVDKVEQGWTHNARVITRAWLKEGLKPRCITRDLKWGIPVPLKGFEQKVFYVWFDAPFGYVSMTKHYTKSYQQWWNPSGNVHVELFQFMAKDNIPFHSVMWPSVLLAMGEQHTLVSHIMATEYLNYEDGKFSKSRGVGVFGNDVMDTNIPADVWRFYLASIRPESQDSYFSWSDLATRNNSELLNNLGNFVYRALVFCEKNFDSTIPDMTLSADDIMLLATVNRELEGYYNAMEKAKLRDGIRQIFSISKLGNGYMQAQQPWKLLNGTAEQKIRAGTIIGICINLACWLGNLVCPFMPTTGRTLLQQLNTKRIKLDPKNAMLSILLPAGHRISKSATLFSKLDTTYIDQLKDKYSGTKTAETESEHVEVQSVNQLRVLIEEQGNKIRQLKAASKDKTTWQSEVALLLNLKERLMTAEKGTSAQATKK